MAYKPSVSKKVAKLLVHDERGVFSHALLEYWQCSSHMQNDTGKAEHVWHLSTIWTAPSTADGELRQLRHVANVREEDAEEDQKHLFASRGCHSPLIEPSLMKGEEEGGGEWDTYRACS